MPTSMPPTSAPPTAVRPAQAALHARLATGLDALDARLAAAASAVPPGRWGERRADGGWSVGETLEHLRLANVAYLGAMSAAVTRAGATTGGDWRPSLAGRLLVRSLVSPRRLPAPGAIRPGPTPGADVLPALLATHAALRALLTQAEGLDWRRLRFASPFAWLVRLNLGDAGLIVLRHGERHAGQLERLAAELRGR